MRDLSVLSGSGVERLRRQAKALRRGSGLQYCKALDVVARARGFRDWWDVIDSGKQLLGGDVRGRGGR